MSLQHHKAKTITGKYRDDVSTAIRYQRKFVQEIKKLEPKALDDLRSLTPCFIALFGENISQCGETLRELRENLEGKCLDLRICSLDDLQEKKPGARLKPLGEKTSPSFEVPLGKTCGTYQWGTVKDLLFSQQHFSSIESDIVTAFQDSSPQQNLIAQNFLELQKGIYQWAEHYNLKKDWLIDYAYYFILEFSRDEHLSIAKITVPLRPYFGSLGLDFEFKFRGWAFADEDADSYESCVTLQFKTALRQYFSATKRDFDLSNKTKITRPPDFTRVKWLVQWTVQGWTEQEIIFAELESAKPRQTADGAVKKKALWAAFDQFKNYDLPVREKI